ncbi:hypothetical protein F4703DRAFT_1934519 [Phycomyces blakesleeanus]
MTMAVSTPFDSQRGTSKVRHSVIQVMNRFKGLHIKMRSVRFTKRASCRSVGPGAKPMRSEQKVNPEASDSKDWIIVSLWDRRHAPPVRLVLSLGLA